MTSRNVPPLPPSFQVGSLYYLAKLPGWLPNEGVTMSAYARCLHTEISSLTPESRQSIAMYGFWQSGTDPTSIWFRLPEVCANFASIHLPILCVDFLLPGKKKQNMTDFGIFMVAEGKFSVLSVREVELVWEHESLPPHERF